MAITRRATLIIDTFCDSADRERLEDWLDCWQSALVTCSDNLGCGCCIDHYDLEAPELALAELPAHWFASSDWAGLQPWLPPETLPFPPSTDRGTE